MRLAGFTDLGGCPARLGVVTDDGAFPATATVPFHHPHPITGETVR